MPPAATAEFRELLLKVADGSWSLLEAFKERFGQASRSSSKDWASSDLLDAIVSQSTDAVAFMDSVWKCLEHAVSQSVAVPSVERLNKVLQKHDVPLRISGDRLVRVVADVVTSKTPDGNAASAVASFELGEQIGSGGFGVVHRATRTTSVGSFEYAIKILEPSPFLDNHEKALDRFRREIRVLGSLQHRCIIQCIEAGMTVDGRPYILMPLVVGTDLRTAASNVSLVKCLRMYLEVMHGLVYAHSKDVVHRDLKPSNVLVRGTDLQPLILDFGSAYLLDEMDTGSLTTAALGTVGYIPSEVLAQPSLRSPLQDVYACGVMLYETLAGRKPDPNNYAPLAESRPECADVDPVIRSAIGGIGTRSDSALMAARLEELVEHMGRRGAG